MKVFGIDPGSARTGYGCVQSDGSRHRMIACGAVTIPAANAFPEKLRIIHVELGVLLARHRPDVVAIGKYVRRASETAARVAEQSESLLASLRDVVEPAGPVRTPPTWRKMSIPPS